MEYWVQGQIRFIQASEAIKPGFVKQAQRGISSWRRKWSQRIPNILVDVISLTVGSQRSEAGVTTCNVNLPRLEAQGDSEIAPGVRHIVSLEGLLEPGLNSKHFWRNLFVLERIRSS